MSSEFLLCNHSPTLLNYVLYLNNIYMNRYMRDERLTFPLVPWPDSGWLLFSEFRVRAKILWERLIDEIERGSSTRSMSNSNYVQVDIEQIQKAEELCKDLFEPTLHGMKRFHETWDSFRAFWIGSLGYKYLIERMTEPTLDEIYKKVEDKFRSSGITIPDGDYCIQVTFDKIPEDYKTSSRHFLIESIYHLLSPADLVVVIENLFNIIK